MKAWGLLLALVAVPALAQSTAPAGGVSALKGHN